MWGVVGSGRFAWFARSGRRYAEKRKPRDNDRGRRGAAAIKARQNIARTARLPHIFGDAGDAIKARTSGGGAVDGLRGRGERGSGSGGGGGGGGGGGWWGLVSFRRA